MPRSRDAAHAREPGPAASYKVGKMVAAMPRARQQMDSRRAGVTPVCVRPESDAQRAAWFEAATAANESVGSLVRSAVDVELERRRGAQACAVERPDPYGLEALLERSQSTAVD